MKINELNRLDFYNIYIEACKIKVEIESRGSNFSENIFYLEKRLRKYNNEKLANKLSEEKISSLIKFFKSEDYWEFNLLSCYNKFVKEYFKQ